MDDVLVQIQGMCKSYRSGNASIHALSAVSLVVRTGDFLAIVGHSGSGKSTLLHVLGLLDRPDSGGYLLRGQCVEDLDEATRAAVRNREIGFVFQSPTLMARATSIENVALPLVYAGLRRGERDRRAEAALDRVGLARRASHWPQQLSGGEQQRVAIARAIVSRPALILADEPTGSLDRTTRGEILSLFVDLNRDGHTIIVVTHDIEVAKRANRCITLRDGRIIEDTDQPSSARRPIVRAR